MAYYSFERKKKVPDYAVYIGAGIIIFILRYVPLTSGYNKSLDAAASSCVFSPTLSGLLSFGCDWINYINIIVMVISLALVLRGISILYKNTGYKEEQI